MSIKRLQSIARKIKSVPSEELSHVPLSESDMKGYLRFIQDVSILDIALKNGHYNTASSILNDIALIPEYMHNHICQKILMDILEENDVLV